MKTFVAVVHKDADSADGAHFPDIPGCFPAAERFDEVLPNAAEALALFFEESSSLEPRDLEGIRAGVADDIAEGAVRCRW